MSLEDAFKPGTLRGLTLRNRILKAATFEGKTPGGVPGEDYLRFHQGILEGGAAMTTLAYCASEADGRISPHMMAMDEAAREPLTQIISALKGRGGAVSGQLVHCGGFSRNGDLQRLKRPLGPSWKINAAGITEGIPFTGAMNLDDIEMFKSTFAEAAAFMKAVGFDAIELHFGHGYGLGQFLSPKTNHRNDAYGGSLTKRLRLPLDVLSLVRTVVGDDMPILAKLSLTEGVKGGIEEGEAIETAVALSDNGADLIIPSGGSSSFNPMLMFRGESFLKGLVAQEQSRVLRLGLRLAGGAIFKPYPYEPTYFLEAAGRLKDQVSCPVAYIGGCATGQDLSCILDAGFDYVQLGRALIADPTWPQKVEADASHQSPCNHCNRCVPLIDAPGGIQCVLGTSGQN